MDGKEAVRFRWTYRIDERLREDFINFESALALADIRFYSSICQVRRMQDTHIDIHAYIHAIHTYIHAIHTHIHTYIHDTYIHTYTHTCIVLMKD